MFPITAHAQTTLTNGALVADTLLVNTTNVYTFQGTNGDAILLRAGSPSINPRIVLRDPSGQVFATAGSGVSGVRDVNIAVQATNTGTFTVEVSSIFAGGAGAYNVNLARVPADFIVSPGDDGGPIANGWLYTGTNSIGDMDLWSFTASAGDSIIVRMGSATFNPWIRVYGPDGKLVATAGGGSAGFLTVDLATQATNAGTYVIVTSSFSVDGAGNYNLTLAKSPGTVFVAPGDEGGPMTNGWEHTGTISPGDLDVWTFDANAGDSVVLRMGSPGLNPWIRLFGPDGKQVATAGNGTAGFLNVDMATQVTNAGTYTVVVGSFSGNVTGSYVLNLAKPGPIFVAPGDEGGPMTNGWEHAGNLDLGDLDVWTFNANAGDSIVLRMGATNYNPYIRLYGPDGKQVATAGSGVAGFRNVDLLTQATNGGAYTVVASSFSGNTTGGYILNLAKSPGAVFVSPDDEGGQMTNGWEHVGNLDLGDLDVWTFNANAGDNVVIRMGATNYNPLIRLFGPNGKEVAVAGSGVSGALNTELSTQATNTGSYTVVASSFSGNSTGGYILNFARPGSPVFAAPGDEGGTLTNGWEYNGNLDLGDLDAWTFNANSGDTLVFRMGATNYNPWVRVYGTNGNLVATAGNGVSGAHDQSFSVIATNGGTYTVIATSFSGNGIGNYVFNLAQLPGLFFVAPGDEGGLLVDNITKNGTIDLGDMDIWHFGVCRAQTIILTCQKLSGTLTPRIRLYSANGALLATASSTPTATLSYGSTNSGAYTAIVDGNGVSDTGTYQLTGNGFSDELHLCPLILLNTNVDLAAIGGTSNATFVIYTSTNAATPLTNWTPLLTNHFNSSGGFEITNSITPNLPKQFFWMTVPQ